MGKKDREKHYQYWLEDVQAFSHWYPLAVRPTDTRLRELYSAGYGTEQAARQLHEEEKVMATSKGDTK